MATKRTKIPLPFLGGYATEFGPESNEITHFLAAENIIWHLDGGFQKMPGATKLNSTAITEAAVAQTIMGMFDYWRSGTGGSFSQKRICHAGTKILKEDMDGTWDDLFTGLESGKIPSYETLGDIVVMASDSNVDVPRSWDQTTAQNLAGSPPNFAFCVAHKRRLFAAGVATNPSRLYYTVYDTPVDWTGSGSGSIDIDVNDGDNIVGLASHKNELFIFKGPNKGSIHRLSGTSSTDFAMAPFVKSGIALASHNSIVKYGDDLAFVSTIPAVHSLTATQDYGDYHEAFLSRPIDGFWQDTNKSRLKFIQGINFPARGICLWTVSQSGQSQNNKIAVMDYRFLALGKPIRWSVWTVGSAASLALMKDSNGIYRPYFGRYDGFVYEGDKADRSWAGTAYTARLLAPYIHHEAPDLLKIAAKARTGIQPKGNYNFTFGWQMDDNSQQTDTVSQAGTNALDSFVLGTDTLAGAMYSQKYVDMSGSYRAVQFEFKQTGDSQDMEIHTFGLQIEPSGLSEE